MGWVLARGDLQPVLHSARRSMPPVIHNSEERPSIVLADRIKRVGPRTGSFPRRPYGYAARNARPILARGHDSQLAANGEVKRARDEHAELFVRVAMLRNHRMRLHLFEGEGHLLATGREKIRRRGKSDDGNSLSYRRNIGTSSAILILGTFGPATLRQGRAVSRQAGRISKPPSSPRSAAGVALASRSLRTIDRS